MRLKSEYLPGWEKSTSQLTWVVRAQCLGGCGAEAHASLLAASQGRSPFCLQANDGVLNLSMLCILDFLFCNQQEKNALLLKGFCN